MGPKANPHARTRTPALPHVNTHTHTYIPNSLNLPPWLVDLRHDISHNDLPTLPCLRVASLQFLEFLFERFWDVKTEQIGAAVSDVNSLLSQYKSASKRNESTREICKNLASSPRSVVTSCAIKFLVHDGDCSSKASSKQKQPSELYKRGALIPGNPSTILSDEKGFEYILKRYKQILFEVSSLAVCLCIYMCLCVCVRSISSRAKATNAHAVLLRLPLLIPQQHNSNSYFPPRYPETLIMIAAADDGGRLFVVASG